MTSADPDQHCRNGDADGPVSAPGVNMIFSIVASANMISSIVARASLWLEKRLKFSINPRKLSIFYRAFPNRREALIVANMFFFFFFVVASTNGYNLPHCSMLTVSPATARGSSPLPRS